MAKIFKKGSQAAKDHMAQVRAAKKISGTKKKPAVKQRGSSNTVRDKMLKAKPPGKRKSESGKIYSEIRKNRTDAPGKLTGIDSDSFILKALDDLKNEYKRLESWNIQLTASERKKIITTLKKLTLLLNKRYLYINK
jgi:hypothetical protein